MTTTNESKLSYISLVAEVHELSHPFLEYYKSNYIIITGQHVHTLIPTLS